MDFAQARQYSGTVTAFLELTQFDTLALLCVMSDATSDVRWASARSGPVTSERTHHEPPYPRRPCPLAIALSAQAPAVLASTPAASPALYAETAAPSRFPAPSPPTPSMLLPPARSPPPPPRRPSKARSPSQAWPSASRSASPASVSTSPHPWCIQRLNLRGGASFFSYTPSTITTDNLNINGNIKFQNAATMVDWFPSTAASASAAAQPSTTTPASPPPSPSPTGQSFTVGGTTYYSEPYNAVTRPPPAPSLAPASSPSAATRSFRAPHRLRNCCPRRATSASRARSASSTSPRPPCNIPSPAPAARITPHPTPTATDGPIPQANITTEQNKLPERPLRPALLPHPLLRPQLQNPLRNL